MRTRASAKRESKEEPLEVSPAVVQPQVADEQPPQKRARRKGPAQPVRGGWDELPHNLGKVELAPKEAVTPFAKARHSTPYSIIVPEGEQ